MVKRTTRTADEQKLLDDVAKAEFLRCLAKVKRDSYAGCAQHAYDAAEAFINERGKRK